MTSRSHEPREGRCLTVDLPTAQRGERLDHVLAVILPDQSRAAIQRLIRDGRVRLAGGPARASHRVRGGEHVEIRFAPVIPSAFEAEDRPLAILHEDDDLLVLVKPPGLTVHPGAGRRSGTLVNALLHHCNDLSGIGGVERPGIVHRLDRETSGVLVVAKGDAAHRSLAAQFKERSVRKLYEAVVWGRPRKAEGVIESAIGRHPVARVKMAVGSGGRTARTSYRLISCFGPVSLLELRPETGRTHQLRVHLQSVGHPILGDRRYGGWRGRTVRGARFGAAIGVYDGMALHARRLGFAHPRSGSWCEFEAPRPENLQQLLDRLRTAATETTQRRGV